MEKISQALECCASLDRSCDECSYKGVKSCEITLMRDAARALAAKADGDLISRSALQKRAQWFFMEDECMGEFALHYVDIGDVEDAPAVEVEPVIHAHWEDEYGGKYANPRYRCSACKEKSLYNMEQDMLLSWRQVQVLTDRCPYCGAHMDEEVAE